MPTTSLMEELVANPKPGTEMQLVLGATGGVGHWVVEKLLDRKNDVRVMVRNQDEQVLKDGESGGSSR